MYGILDQIDSPADIKGLSIDELKQLCAEIRSYIVECCSNNPGHLASSLGAVELIVGFHYVFDSPSDKIVFDVGHQAYAHKIITGRRAAFASARTAEGISGFPKMSESPYDAFGVGHSSTSISAAVGLAEAAKLRGRHEKVVALIGDGALSGGLAFEGLNNAGASHSDLLVILNDNDHSIDDNKGALRQYLLRMTTSKRYNIFKDRVWKILGESETRSFLQRWTRSLKSWFVKKSGGDLFEAFGFRYFGPIDGNDIGDVVSTLRKLKQMQGPRIMHSITVKGKGYAPAEADPTTWHAPGKFDPSTGERQVRHYDHDRYQDVFGQVLCELAGLDERVVGITPAMSTGCGMNRFAEAFPERFYDVGIEEEHAVTFSAGLAAGGMKPFCNIYSSFSQRAYDQIIHDVALQNLPVTLCLDRAGLVGEDGATHHGMFDLAAYRPVPNTIISAPKDEVELKRLMYTSLHHATGPFIIRYPRGTGEGADWKSAKFEELPVGKAEVLAEGDTVALVCIGPCTYRAMEAAAAFPGRVGVYNFRFLKPLDEETLAGIAGAYRHIITVEDGAVKGGLFGAVSEFTAARCYGVGVTPAGVPDAFVPHGRQDTQRRNAGIDRAGIEAAISIILKKES